MKNTAKDLNVGIEVYYTGDMANQPGFGMITAYRASVLGWDIRLKDGRVMLGIQPSNFYGDGGSRFTTKAEYMRDRAERISAMQSRMVEMGIGA